MYVCMWVGVCTIYVQSTARHAIHLKFEISTNALKIRVVLSSKVSDVLLTVRDKFHQ
jgi:hypothetical protein